jgi:diguanylate cyclase (GGDEF)-like protein
MNVYAFIPLLAIIAYIPLLVMTLRSRPWLKQHKIFVLLLVTATLWSMADYVFRSHFFPQFSFLLFKIIIVLFVWMAVQLHAFASSFFPPNRSRWLVFAYASLAGIVGLVIAGVVPEGVITRNGVLYPQYGAGILFLVVPLMSLLLRDLYVLLPRLKNQDNPVIYSQSVTVLVSLLVLTVFGIAAILPFAREFPISHIGNIVIAFILSYSVVNNQLVDIRFVMRRGLTLVSTGVIALAAYWLLLFGLHSLLRIEFGLSEMVGSAAAAILVVLMIYRTRGLMFGLLGQAFQGRSYHFRQKLQTFADNIHTLFSLQEQGSELLVLVTKSMGCQKAGLLFRETPDGDFVVQLTEPKKSDDALDKLTIRWDNPIAAYLQKYHKCLTQEEISILPELRGIWGQEKEGIIDSQIELFIPIVSRENLIGIMVLDKKRAGRYTLEDFGLLGHITSRVAVSIEKEYLREQLKAREEELSIINRSSAILTSSLDIQRIYDKFITELRKIVDVSWATISLIEGKEIYFLAVSSEGSSAWKVGERIALEGSATEWVTGHRKSLIIPDLSTETRFATSKYLLQSGMKAVAYVPLIIVNEVIGTLTVASGSPGIYTHRHLTLLEQLASQIAMPVENSILYAKTERMARIDELTGLFNRRSLDEMLAGEIGRHSRYGGIFSVIILDLDSFKSYNDRYGHLSGDSLLRQIGGIIKTTIRETDQAFRYGGDEFAVLLPQTSVEAATRVAERVRTHIFARVSMDAVPVSVSLGLATWPEDGVGPNDVISAADTALYQAKRAGGNRVQKISDKDTLIGSSQTSNSEARDSETLAAIYSLAATVDARDHYSRAHSKKVNECAMAIAVALGLQQQEIGCLGTCALLHDIGKIGINDEILNKIDKLSDEEWEIIRSHSQLGAAVASHSSHLVPCISGILHHHERYDGTGYPHRLKGTEIPLASRILAIADSFVSMTSDRPYTKALNYGEAVEEIKRGSGTQFDPALVEVALPVIQKIIAASVQAKIGGGKV